MKVRVVAHEPFVGSHPCVRRDHKHEIRIDDDVAPKWRRFVEYHERVEHALMKRGLKYAEAHKIATEKEKELFKKKFGARWKEMWQRYMRHVYYVASKEQSRR